MYNPWFMLYILFTCFSFNSYLGFAFGTISANQSLSGDQTISSKQGKFKLGFFQPGNPSNCYIGIWYNTLSQLTPVWIANRERPVFDKYSSNLTISNGNLVLLNEKGVAVWSTNLSSTTSSSSSVEAVLHDDGNLVLRDGATSLEPLWQSFDYPTDTLLPRGRLGINKITGKSTRLTSWKSREDPAPGLFSIEIDPNGTSQFYIMRNRSQIMWTSGTWNGQFFSLIPEMRLNYFYNFSYVSNENENYLTYSLYNTSIVSRFLIDAGGQLQQQSWIEGAGQWNILWSQPMLCEAYGYCGAFGICNQRSQPFCQCLTGFRPFSESEWNSRKYSGGCTRTISVQCGNSSSDKFLARQDILLPSNPLVLSYLTAQQCESSCWNNCSCIAYAFYNSKCSIWYQNLLNLRQLADNDLDRQTLYIRLAASELSSSNKNKNKTLIAGVTAGSVVILLFPGLFLFLIFRRRKIRRIEKVSGSKCEINYRIAAGGGQNDTQLVLFSFESVLAATNKFSEENKLGEGGFGPVYKGNLAGDQQVAIKRLSQKSGQGVEEFMNELKLIANLQHKYLVRLLGCCVEGEEKILIYEYMANRSLDKFLFDPSEKGKLVWDKRFKIVEGVAQGLLYIHKFSRLKIIHRDLKASNILLDEAMNPKISDFGMARIFGINQTEANTNRVMGTYGYMSPEYAFSGQFSEKSDVFSFGVFLLEIVSGRRNTSFHRSGLSLTLLSWAWELWKEGKEAELIDASMKETCSLKETVKCIHVGLLCVQEDPADRPTMSLVVLMLTTDTQTLASPKEPAFHSCRVADCFAQRHKECSNNELTISLPTGR